MKFVSVSKPFLLWCLYGGMNYHLLLLLLSFITDTLFIIAFVSIDTYGTGIAVLHQAFALAAIVPMWVRGVCCVQE